jgi:hypothetical protein
MDLGDSRVLHRKELKRATVLFCWLQSERQEEILFDLFKPVPDHRHLDQRLDHNNLKYGDENSTNKR